MKKFFMDIVTGIDGTTYDPARVFLALGCLVMIAGGIRAVVSGHLDFVGFGTGFGGLLLGAGAAIWIKRDSEPGIKVTATRDDGKGNVSQVETTA